MYNTILFTILFLILPISGYSQFYTIKKEIQQKSIEYYDTDSYEYIKQSPLKPKGKEEPIRAKTKDSKDTLRIALCTKKVDESTSPKETKKKQDKRKAMYPKKAPMKSATPLPQLTIPNLYRELLKNQIKYPHIVLAQAILETGWFRSSLCRERHNLFGLTNPRTGKYFEFAHWTESVRAYYTTVQYKYTGGNYLLWLRNIGYAEDPNYIQSLVKILAQYL